MRSALKVSTYLSTAGGGAGAVVVDEERPATSHYNFYLIFICFQWIFLRASEFFPLRSTLGYPTQMNYWIAKQQQIEKKAIGEWIRRKLVA